MNKRELGQLLAATDKAYFETNLINGNSKATNYCLLQLQCGLNETPRLLASVVAHSYAAELYLGITANEDASTRDAVTEFIKVMLQSGGLKFKVNLGAILKLDLRSYSAEYTVTMGQETESPTQMTFRGWDSIEQYLQKEGANYSGYLIIK